MFFLYFHLYHFPFFVVVDVSIACISLFFAVHDIIFILLPSHVVVSLPNAVANAPAFDLAETVSFIHSAVEYSFSSLSFNVNLMYSPYCPLPCSTRVITYSFPSIGSCFLSNTFIFVFSHLQKSENQNYYLKIFFSLKKKNNIYRNIFILNFHFIINKKIFSKKYYLTYFHD